MKQNLVHSEKKISSFFVNAMGTIVWVANHDVRSSSALHSILQQPFWQELDAWALKASASASFSAEYGHDAAGWHPLMCPLCHPTAR